jgi:hypothetical protein
LEPRGERRFWIGVESIGATLQQDGFPDCMEFVAQWELAACSFSAMQQA